MIYDENEDLGDHRSAMIRFASTWRSAGRSKCIAAARAAGCTSPTPCAPSKPRRGWTEYAVINIGHPDVVPIEALAEMIRATLGADRSLVTHPRPADAHDAREAADARPAAAAARREPKVSLEEGVRRVCARVQERIRAGELPGSR